MTEKGQHVEAKRLELTHGPYKRGKHMIDRARIRQIEKGLEKYPEPLNPDSWTVLQLVNHIMEELADTVHYAATIAEKYDTEPESERGANELLTRDVNILFNEVRQLRQTANEQAERAERAEKDAEYYKERAAYWQDRFLEK